LILYAIFEHDLAEPLREDRDVVPLVLPARFASASILPKLAGDNDKVDDGPIIERAALRIAFEAANEDRLVDCHDPRPVSHSIRRETPNRKSGISAMSSPASAMPRRSQSAPIEGYTDLVEYPNRSLQRRRIAVEVDAEQRVIPDQMPDLIGCDSATFALFAADLVAVSWVARQRSQSCGPEVLPHVTIDDRDRAFGDPDIGAAIFDIDIEPQAETTIDVENRDVANDRPSPRRRPK
jgi:hypothetical protein